MSDRTTMRGPVTVSSRKMESRIARTRDVSRRGMSVESG
jgi:hypothetical protein